MKKTKDNYYALNLLFADDQVVITRGAENTNFRRRIPEEEYEKWGLERNYRKTEYLSTDHSEELQINRNTIPTVKQFKYLGSVVQEKAHLTLKLK
jgi:hypothetical protein